MIGQGRSERLTPGPSLRVAIAVSRALGVGGYPVPSGLPGPALDEFETEPPLHAQVTVGDVMVEG